MGTQKDSRIPKQLAAKTTAVLVVSFILTQANVLWEEEPQMRKHLH